MAKRLLFLGLLMSIASPAFAQRARPAPSRQTQAPATGENSVGTPVGSEINFNVDHYKYTEPGTTPISIHGMKFGGEYTGTLSISRAHRLFAQVNVRGVAGSATYDGFCSPWQITPNSSSPNGYALTLGSASPCSESGDRDWYMETRGLAGKDFIGHSWGFSPFGGVGLRYLSNGTTGTPGFRTDRYVYIPLGVTVRTTTPAHRVLGFTLEYDHFVRGWQHTYNSKLGGGLVPATQTTPAFTIVGFSDVAFDQHGGWALRTSANYQVTRHWSVEPYYVRWHVDPSPANDITATFTVNSVTAKQLLGFYEPLNFTNEFGVKIGLRFGRSK